ncbi:MAG: endonuclease/exonuclease/phosphatase family protein [Saprospiraceae bacterium]|nr:endonuclease/exonuclease/phosphatase family protein [Saprospiraceae bacterium]
MLRFLMTVIGGLLALATLLALLAPWIPPDQFWLPLFTAYGFVYLVMAQALLIVYWLFRPGRGMWITVLALLFCLPSLGRHMQFGGSRTTDKKSIQVTTFNAHALVQLWKTKTKNHKVDPALIDSLFPDDRRPDILCLQEIPRAYKPEGKDWGMPAANIYRYRNTVLISRYPLKNKGEKDFAHSGNSIIWADVQTPLGKVRVYNAHLQSHRIITKETEILLEAPMNDKNTWKGYRSVLGRVKRSTAMRAEQARWLAEEVAKCTLPVLILGDFNDTPQSYSYRTVAEGLDDSFQCGGSGFGTTFAGKIPGLRIDYILGGKGIAFLDHHIQRVSLSDHYPVSARVTFDEKPANPE